MRVLGMAMALILISAAGVCAHGLEEFGVEAKRQFLWEQKAMETSCSRDARMVNGKLHRQMFGWDNERNEYFILDAFARPGDDKWTLRRYYFNAHALKRMKLVRYMPSRMAREAGLKPWSGLIMNFRDKAVRVEELSIRAEGREDRTTPAESFSRTGLVRMDMCSPEAGEHLLRAFKAVSDWTEFEDMAVTFKAEGEN